MMIIEKRRQRKESLFQVTYSDSSYDNDAFMSWSDVFLTLNNTSCESYNMRSEKERGVR